MIQLQRVEVPDRKSAICDQILRSLPDWFGIETAIVEYVNNIRPFPFWAAMDADNSVGFAAVKRHNAFTAELYVIGVAPAYHRQGIGQQLVRQCAADCRAQGLKFLTVKTLDESAHSEHYDRTRAFYRKLGFLPLEVFPEHWDKSNPCLLMVLPL